MTPPNIHGMLQHHMTIGARQNVKMRNELNKCANIHCENKVRQNRYLYCCHDCKISKLSVFKGEYAVINDIEKVVLYRGRFSKKSQLKTLMDTYAGRPVIIQVTPI